MEGLVIANPNPKPKPKPKPNPNPSPSPNQLCHELGEEKRQRVGLYHPPSNSSIITHNLKNGGQTVAWELMQPHSTYDHRRCMSDWMHREPRRWGG